MSLENILSGKNVVANINENMNILLSYIPEISFIIDFDQKDPTHSLDLWNHTLLALYYSDDEFDVRLALLLHDISKPFNYKDYRGKGRRYDNIAFESSTKAMLILKRLGFNRDLIDRVMFLISNYDKRIDNNLIIKNRELARKLFMVQYCNAIAHNNNFFMEKEPYLYDVKQKIKREETRLFY